MNVITALLPAITTIAGAIIGATVSYLVSRHQFRAAVLSGNRQAWINALRDNLAEFEATLYDVFADFHSGGALRDASEGIAALRRANLIMSRVKLF